MIENIDSEFPTKQSLSTPTKILAVIKNNQSNTQEKNDTSLSIEPLETKRIEVTQFLATAADDTPRSLAVKHTLKPQREKNQPEQIKFLESTVNANAEVFTIGSKIQVIRSTFGNYNAIIEEIYQTADRVVWAKYSSFPSDRVVSSKRATNRVKRYHMGNKKIQDAETLVFSLGSYQII
ncbi:MAG: hypothetical protein H0X31_00150 [Nostocaceae cyanobacterium]|nr:hypothetical protein [Nostocaceae cyanobacterium]